MTDRIHFEARLEDRLRARAALASRPFDAAAIAHEAIAAGAHRRGIGRLEWPSTRPALQWLVIALLLTVALLGLIAGIGALLRELSPLLPAVASNGWIAVSANPNEIGGGEVGDIYLVVDGAPTRRIVGSDGDGIAQACPTFSPDGRRLAYGEARASEPVTTFRGDWPVGDRAVVVVGLNDQGDASPSIVRVALPTDPGEIICPQWSPSGEQVAFRVGTELWVADAASGEKVVFVVTEAPRGQQRFAWSGDGSLIAVSEPGQIRVLRLDGRPPAVIPVQGATPSSIAWTAGDTRIVYVSTDAPGDGLTGRVVDADGTNDTQLTPIGAALAVSPDGSRVAYVTGPPLRVVTTDIARSNVVEVPVPPEFDLSGLLSWSPDGKRLLLGSIQGLVSVAAEPGSPAVVHSSGELNLEWSWSEVTWQPVFK